MFSERTLTIAGHAEETGSSDTFTPPPNAPQGGYPGEGYNQGRYYPETNEFPPPPVSAPNYNHDPNYAQPAPYNPADYAPPPGVTGAYGQEHYPYTPPPAQGDNYVNDPRYRRGDENVSAPPAPEHFNSGGSRRMP